MASQGGRELDLALEILEVSSPMSSAHLSYRTLAQYQEYASSVPHSARYNLAQHRTSYPRSEGHSARYTTAQYRTFRGIR
eukprot:1625838-Rhodomonas_salina.3